MTRSGAFTTAHASSSAIWRAPDIISIFQSAKLGVFAVRIFLTFDVEIWCGGWDKLDERFSAAYRRYVYGGTERDGYALPMTLRILSEHELKATFFVEPLFSARFGADKLRTIVDLIQEAGQEVQLHLHPEWCDEAGILPGSRNAPKRPHLWQFSLSDQEALIRIGMEMLRSAGVQDMRAFRAGSFGANLNTLRALTSVGLEIDSSLNATVPQSFPDGHAQLDPFVRSAWMGLHSIPIGVFIDGFGRMRHAQVGACSFRELSHAIDACTNDSWREFVLLSHGFEMLKNESAERDSVVARRFRRLCAFLRDRRESGRIRVTSMSKLVEFDGSGDMGRLPVRVSTLATLERYIEQAYRRCL